MIAWMIIGKRLFESFLIVFAAASTATAVISVIAVVTITTVVAATRLEFRVAFVPVVVISASFISTNAFVGAGCSYERSICKCKLAFGNIIQFTLDCIIVNYFFMPVAVSEFHIIGHCIRES